MPKRAQVSIFMIIGIILLIAVGAFFYLNKLKITEGMDKKAYADFDRQSVESYITLCLKQVSENSIFEIASKGGTFLPDSNISYDNKEPNILAEYQSGFGYNNKMLLKESMEKELSEKIKQNLTDCIDWNVFTEQGIKVNEGEININTAIIINDVNVVLKYPLELEKQNSIINFDKFSSNINLPLGKFYAASMDIINQEIQIGFFDKEQFMLEQNDLKIEKHRPYPYTIYIIKQFNRRFNKNFVFQFAIKGINTAGKEVLQNKQKGCCNVNNICFKNIDASQCTSSGTYDSSSDCSCQKNLEPSIEGCCKINNNCKPTTENGCKDLSGVFYRNDLKCKQADCQNLDCTKTYDYAENDDSGPYKKHGESWCNYESMAANGVDYVGTRHYLHSCINGIEYIEPCRDFREELCTEIERDASNKYYSKAICRINRWYDCEKQTNEADCENQMYRDCVWADHITSQKKCHPETTPGLKFWEGNNKICNIASLDKDDYGKENKRSWGESTLLYCQRTADCGNYRNAADDITKLGYYNRDGEAEDWLYWEDGWIKNGSKFVIRKSLYKIDLLSNVEIPQGTVGGYAVCDIWKAPAANKCDFCNNKKYPCTEYKCKSLGRDCVYQNAACKLNPNANFDGPTAEIKEIKDYNYNILTNPTYPRANEYKITDKIEVHQPLYFEFRTSEPSRCKLSLYPPGLRSAIVTSTGFSINDILLNDYDYKVDYNLTLRFPSSSFTMLNQYNLFISCYDKDGNYQDPSLVISLETKEIINDIEKPEIIEILPKKENLIFDSDNLFNLFVNEPFNSCRYSTSNVQYNDMNDLGCETEEYNILFIRNYPLGSYVCSATINIPAGTNSLYFACEDKKGNVNDLVGY